MKIYPNKEIKKNITDEIKSISKSIRKIEKSLGEYNSACDNSVKNRKIIFKTKNTKKLKTTQKSNKKFTQKSKRLMQFDNNIFKSRRRPYYEGMIDNTAAGKPSPTFNKTQLTWVNDLRKHY
jgi:hypothetical protein|tara:strand:+ start:169 stop:534 length:366 start_codon:yes stop_codon:yes gene_type:complete